MLLDTSNFSQCLAQRAAATRDDVLEAQGVEFDAIHEDDAHPREGIVIELADRLAGHLAPGELLLVQGAALGIEQIGQAIHQVPPVGTRQ